MKQPSIILLHGLGRSAHAMYFISRDLKKYGYRVFSFSYPSRKARVEVLARWLFLRIKKALGEESFFVISHSMGGIVLRELNRQNRLRNCQGAVMIAPPNKGSYLIDIFGKSAILRRFLGPAALQLHTASPLLKSFLPLNFPVGIIAGNQPLNPFFLKLLKEANDGKVTVAATTLESMTDFCLIPTNHTAILWKRKTLKAVRSFLSKGHF